MGRGADARLSPYARTCVTRDVTRLESTYPLDAATVGGLVAGPQYKRLRPVAIVIAVAGFPSGFDLARNNRGEQRSG